MALRIGNRVFAPSVFTTLATIALGVALASLGRWQLERMHEKQALFAAFGAGATTTLRLSTVAPPDRADRYQHVSAIGRYDSAHQVLLDNMTHGGRAGFQVLTPLIVDAAPAVLVNRGWVALGARRDQLPDVSVPENERSVAGRLDELPAAGIELAAAPQAATAPWPRVASYPKMPELVRALDQPLYPRILLLDPGQADGFVREWRPATFPPERHLGYAITWFALALSLLVIYLVTNLQRAPAGGIHQP